MTDMILVHADRYDQLIQKELVADVFLRLLREANEKGEAVFISSMSVPDIVNFLGGVV